MAWLPDRQARQFGDHSFNPGLEDYFKGIKRQPAAVLVPVIAHEPEATILLTERTHDLLSHPGQIAFPGGKIDTADGSAEAAALREAEEEIGLLPSQVEVLGRGPDYLTGSGFHIAPVLSLVAPGVELTLNPGEVADAFEGLDRPMPDMSSVFSVISRKVAYRSSSSRCQIFVETSFLIPSSTMKQWPIDQPPNAQMLSRQVRMASSIDFARFAAEAASRSN